MIEGIERVGVADRHVWVEAGGHLRQVVHDPQLGGHEGKGDPHDVEGHCEDGQEDDEDDAEGWTQYRKAELPEDSFVLGGEVQDVPGEEGAGGLAPLSLVAQVCANLCRVSKGEGSRGGGKWVQTIPDGIGGGSGARVRWVALTDRSTHRRPLSDEPRTPGPGRDTGRRGRGAAGSVGVVGDHDQPHRRQGSGHRGRCRP